MEALRKIIRWILGVAALLLSLGMLRTGLGGFLMLLGALILIPPLGNALGKLVTPFASHGVALAWGVGLFVAGGIVASRSLPPAQRTSSATSATPVAAPPVASVAPAPMPADNNVPAPAAVATERAAAPPPAVNTSSKIDPDAVLPISGQGWEKTRGKWGNAWIKRINAAMPFAASKVAESDDCDYVELVGLSEQRSTPREEIVFYVDCRNKQRFYVSESESKAGATVESQNAQTEAISDGAAILGCEESVKRQLTNPLTFDRDLFNTSVHRTAQGRIAVEFTFQAKNDLGLELPSKARCIVDDRGVGTAEITKS